MDFVLLAVAVALLVLARLAVPSLAEAPAPPPERPDFARFFTPLLTFGYSLGVLALIVGVVALCQFPPVLNLLRLVLLNRYALLAAVLLIGLIPLALRVLPGLLRSLFVLRYPSHMFNVTWLSLLAAGMVLVTTRVAEHNAAERFGISFAPSDALGDTSRALIHLLLLLLFGLPIPYVCLRCSVLNRKELVRQRYWVHLVLGAVVGLGLLFAAGVVQAVFVPENSQLKGLFPGEQWVAPYLPRSSALVGFSASVAHLLSYLGAGYAQTLPMGELALTKGHAAVLVGATAAAAVYLVSYLWVLTTRWNPNENFWFPPLFFGLLVVILVGFVLQGLAFCLDLYHLPVSLVVVGCSALLYAVNRTDHFFDLRKPTPAEAPAAGPAAPPVPAPPTAGPPTLAQVARAWRLPAVSSAAGQGGKKTLVVVTAAGGGIQAAAWSARVLVGLHQRYGTDFSASIGLISAVSGGSVGVMYFLDQWGTRRQPFAPPALATGADGAGFTYLKTPS
jgi:hypothetical protein